MKQRLIATALIAATAATVVWFPMDWNAAALHNPPPPVQAQPALPAQGHPQVDVVFALDTTGSMSGLIQAAKEKIWSIASSLAQADPAPRIRMGLVAYRDRGDAYVTQVTDLSADLDSLYATLMDLRAGGGGDGPESVNQALADAVNRMSWSQDGQVYKVVFLVGDAPPHMDYQDDVPYPQTLRLARERGIVVNAVQCGNLGGTRQAWEQIAGLGAGSYFQVEQGGSAVAVATPYDAELAGLSARLDATRMYYGSADEKAEKQRKLAATDKLHAAASTAAQARRAAFNASASGSANFLGGKELVDDVASGRVDLNTLDADALPAPLQALAPEAREAMVQDLAEQRAELTRQVRDLADKRNAYLRDKVAESGHAEASLDHKVYKAVREQAAGAGLRYEAEAPRY